MSEGRPGLGLARRRSLRRRGERGLTLIEMLVTIVVITVGVLGIAGALAETEHVSAINQNQSQLEVAMRQLSDFVRDSGPAGLNYAVCAQPSTYNAELPPLPSAVTAWSIPTGGIRLSTAGTRTSAGSSTPIATPPIQYCGTPGVCTSTSPCDWGVQEITLSVSNGAMSLTRTVWKSKTW